MRVEKRTFVLRLPLNDKQVNKKSLVISGCTRKVLIVESIEVEFYFVEMHV